MKADETVWAWGYNAHGQLGDGTYDNSYAPVQVTGIDQVVQVSTNEDHSLALKDDGTVWAWGRNNWNQLGYEVIENSNTPLQVAGLSGIISVCAGINRSIAVGSDGTIWLWGVNDANPVEVTGISDTSPIIAGYGTFLVKSDGTVWQLWYSLGDQIDGLSNIVDFDHKGHHLALDDEGRIFCWGSNTYGQLGRDDVGNTFEPERMQMPLLLW